MSDELLARAAQAVQRAVRGAAVGLVEREVAVELIALAAIAEEHLLVVGEPGTAKSEAVRRVARALGGRYFEYLLGRFTEPSEIFGPVDLVKLQQGKVETLTSGMLPEADVAFLDEVFLGSTAILNTLLALLNERRFHRGHTETEVPLRVCVGASNALPDDAALAAFADRFLVRVFVTPVADAQLEALLQAGNRVEPSAPAASLSDLDRLVQARRAVDLSALRPRLAQAVRLLKKAGIALTDRRVVRMQGLVAAAAALGARSQASPKDLWPIVYAVPTAAEQETAKDVLRGLLTESESPLGAAALEASAGPHARAARIAEAAASLLSSEPPADERESYKLRLEAIMREIDASFAPEALVEPLPALRNRIRELLA